MSDTEKQSRSTAKKDVPPKPKGPAAIDLDSNYANPKGPLTTRASKASDGVMSVPSSGGANRAGKNSSDCDDSLGNPGRFDRTPPADPKVISGRGPAAAKKQLTTGRQTGINSKTKNGFAS